MKKLAVVSLVLALVLALALTTSACGGGAPKTALAAYDIYGQASAAMNNIKSSAAATKMIMTMTMNGEASTIETSGLIKEVTVSESETELQMEMSTKFMGEEMNYTAFYKAGVLYMDTEGQKTRMELPLDQVQERVSTEAFAFPDTAVKDQLATAKDGGQELSFTLDGEALADTLAEQVGSLGAILGGLPDIVMSDIKYTVFVDRKGNLKTTGMSFSLEMGEDGVIGPIEVEISLDYLQINDVSIDFPADLDSYQAP